MASKKEHKRKQRNKGRLETLSQTGSPFLVPGPEINAINLLSAIPGPPHTTTAPDDGTQSHPSQIFEPVPQADELIKNSDTVPDSTMHDDLAERESVETARLCEAERQIEAERARVAAEKAQRDRLAEEARLREAAEVERQAEAERARGIAEKVERERLAEEMRLREAAAEAERRAETERVRIAAEKAERDRLAEEARVREAAAEAERLAEAERARVATEKAERDRLAEEARLRELAAEAERQAEAERVRVAAEEAERERLAEEARVREAAAEAERARIAAEVSERDRLAEETRLRDAVTEAERQAEKERQAEAERVRVAAERAEREWAEEACHRKAAADAVRQAEVERARKAAQPAGRDPSSRQAISGFPATNSAPPLEVVNPYWQKPVEIFDVLSGAPHGVGVYDPSNYTQATEAGAVLPVTMAHGLSKHTAFTHGYGEALNEAAAGPETTVAVPLEKRMYIVMVTPEVAPCAKVGGLGDVILGLGRELLKRGHGVEVICPMYAGMRYDLIQNLHEEYAELWSPHYSEWRSEKVFQGTVEGGLQVNFITGGTYTERPQIYGYEDDLERFTYFSRQALEFMYKTNRRPDIIHCHDWATGLVAPMLWDIYEKLGWNTSRVVYTIHNNECQGLCGFGDKLLGMVGMDVKQYLRADRMQDDTHKNCINMMKAGIVYSNFVTTVSPTYVGELKTAAGGRGLQTTIAKNSAKVGGVLNGIDYDSWNPATDPKLAARYSAGDDFFEKYRNKTALREWLGMWDAWRPIIGVVTRLTHQKGLDLIKHAIYSSRKLQAQFVLLGSAPDPKVNDDFLRIQNELKDNHDINLYIGYHEDLSRLIYAGSDMFLVPSLYEPCGLTQMISLRYGTVPIVRETGGLVDTVFDLDNSGRGLGEANGFTFRDSTPASLDYGLERAVRLWYDNPEAFNRLARNGMRYDYSWRNPAQHYENIYSYVKA